MFQPANQLIQTQNNFLKKSNFKKVLKVGEARREQIVNEAILCIIIPNN